jgi:hypothetical protein
MKRVSMRSLRQFGMGLVVMTLFEVGGTKLYAQGQRRIKLLLRRVRMLTRSRSGGIKLARS